MNAYGLVIAGVLTVGCSSGEPELGSLAGSGGADLEYPDGLYELTAPSDGDRPTLIDIRDRNSDGIVKFYMRQIVIVDGTATPLHVFGRVKYTNMNNNERRKIRFFDARDPSGDADETEETDTNDGHFEARQREFRIYNGADNVDFMDKKTVLFAFKRFSPRLGAEFSTRVQTAYETKTGVNVTMDTTSFPGVVAARGSDISTHDCYAAFWDEGTGTWKCPDLEYFTLLIEGTTLYGTSWISNGYDDWGLTMPQEQNIGMERMEIYAANSQLVAKGVKFANPEPQPPRYAWDVLSP